MEMTELKRMLFGPNSTKEGEPKSTDESSKTSPNPQNDDEDWVFIPNLSDYSFNNLPLEIVVLVFSFVTVRDLARLTFVCRSWKLAAEDDTLWKQFCSEAQSRQLLECPLNKRLLSDHLSWKQIYKETYHLKRDMFGNPSQDDVVEVMLHNPEQLYVCGEGGVVSGEVLLHISSETLKTCGVYLVFTGQEWARERRTDSEGRDKSFVSKLDQFRLCEPLVGHKYPWHQRRKEAIVANRGTHRIPFQVEVPRTGAEDKRLHPSQERVIESLDFYVRYEVSAILVRPWPIWDLRSITAPVKLVASPDNNDQNDDRILPDETEGHLNFILGAGTLRCRVRPNRRSYRPTDNALVHVIVDNSASQIPITAIRLRLIETWVNESPRFFYTITLGTQETKCDVAEHACAEFDIDFPLWAYLAKTCQTATHCITQLFAIKVELKTGQSLTRDLKVDAPIRIQWDL